MTESSPVGVQGTSLNQGPYGIRHGSGKPVNRPGTLESFLPTSAAIGL
jgi:hypothetical protein